LAIKIRIGSLENCADLSFKIPEFNFPYEIKEYKKRCAGKHLALIAEIDNQPVGFKVGYDRFNNGSFYSWMGGVLPDLDGESFLIHMPQKLQKSQNTLNLFLVLSVLFCG